VLLLRQVEEGLQLRDRMHRAGWPLLFVLVLLALAAWMFYGVDRGGRENVRAGESPVTSVAPGNQPGGAGR
jgi:hypothetical protein